MAGLAKKAIESIKKAVIKQAIKIVVPKVTEILMTVTDLVIAQTASLTAMIPLSNKFTPVTDTGARQRNNFLDDKPSEIDIALVKGNPSYDLVLEEEFEDLDLDYSLVPIITCCYCNEDDNYRDERRILIRKVLERQKQTKLDIISEVSGGKALTQNEMINDAVSEISGQIDRAWDLLKNHILRIFNAIKNQCKGFNPLAGLEDLPEAFGNIGLSIPAAFVAIGEATALSVNFIKGSIELISSIIAETTALAGNPFTSSAAPGYLAKEMMALLSFVEDCKEKKDQLIQKLDDAMAPIDAAILSLGKLEEILNDNPATSLLAQIPGSPINFDVIESARESLRAILDLFNDKIKNKVVTAINAALLPLGGYTGNLVSILPESVKKEMQNNKYQTDFNDRMADANKANEESTATAIKDTTERLQEKMTERDELSKERKELEDEIKKSQRFPLVYALSEEELKEKSDRIKEIDEVELAPINKEIDNLTGQLKDIKEKNLNPDGTVKELSGAETSFDISIPEN
jgi:hypothetical protein